MKAIRQMIKRLTAGVAASTLVLTLGAALPATAVDTRDNGNFYDSSCNSFTDPYVHGLFRGIANITPPGAGYYVTSSYSASWRHTNVKGVSQGGYWEVAASLQVDRPGTYGFCGDGTP